MKSKLLIVIFFCCLSAQSFAQTADALYQEGKVLFSNKNYEEALKKLNACLKQDSTFKDAYVYRGTCEYYLGNIDGACINWLKAKNLGVAGADRLQSYQPASFDPNKTADAYIEDGKKRFEKSDYYGSMLDFTNAIYLRPDYERAFYKRAYSLVNMEKYEEALLDYDMAIKLNSTDAKLFTFRGIAKAKKGDTAGACADIKISISMGYDKGVRVLEAVGCK